MKTRHFAMILSVLLPAAPAFPQSAAAGIAADFQRRRGAEQQILHEDARDYRDLSSEELRKQITSYRAETEAYRENALEVAARARAGGLPAGSGASIRNALEADMSLWHYLLPVSRRDWNAMNNQWLVPVASLTDQQWAQQRASWFSARDAWLESRMQQAQLIRH